MRRFLSFSALAALCLIGKVQAIPGGGLLWSSLNTTAPASNGSNSTAIFTNGPTLNANQTAAFVGSGAGLIAFDVINGKPLWLTPGVQLATLSRPAVGRERIFAHVSAGNLTAFDGATGKMAWTYPIPGAGGSTPVLSPGEEVVFVGGYAVQTASGKLLWELPNSGPVANVTGNPSIHPDGTMVFVGDEEGGLFALDSMTGQAIWAVAAYGAIRGTPAISSDGRVVFAAAADGMLYALTATEGGLLWSFKFGKGPLAGDLSPVVTTSGDVAVVVGGDGEVLGLDALDGSLLWNVTVPGGPIVLTPTMGKSFSRNVLYTVAADGTLTALDVLSGDMLWVLPAIGSFVGPTAAPITADGATLIFATRDKGLLGVATDLGREMWGYGANNKDISATAAIVDEGGKAVVPTSRGLTHIDLETGAERWLLPIDVSFTPVISPDGAMAYILSVKNKAIRAIRVDDGKVMWRVANVSGPSFSAAPALSPEGAVLVVPMHSKKLSKLAAHNTHSGELMWEAPAELGIVSSPLVGKIDGGKDVVFYGSLDKKVHALDMASGKALWATETDGWITATPTLSPDGKFLYVGSEDNVIYALNAKDGKVAWSVTSKGGIFAQPALASDGNMLIMTSRDGSITAIDTRAKDETSRMKWAVHTQAQLSGAAFSPDDVAVYVGTDVGELLAIDASNGRLLWTYEAVGPIHTTPTVVPPHGGAILVTTANGLLASVRALPAGHHRATAGKGHDQARDKEGSHEGSSRRHRRAGAKNGAKIAGIVITVLCSLALVGFGGYTLARKYTRESGKPTIPVRLADLTNLQRPRGSVPQNDPDAGVERPRGNASGEVEMEII